MNQKVLFTGGSGLLGSAIQKLRPDWLYPTHERVDVLNYQTLYQFVKMANVETIVHAAALVPAAKCEEDPLGAMMTNMLGTMNVVAACGELGLRLVYVSTDYVYPGNEGAKPENYPLYPILKYGWSKLGGECACRMYDGSLIVRLSFGKDEFPYDGAFDDQWTSREPVSKIAPKLIKVIESDVIGVINVGGKRQTVYDYALQNITDGRTVNPIKRESVKQVIPFDTSLSTDKYDSIFGETQ